VLALELHHDKPTSPLVNAGAMVTTSFVQAADSADRWRKILDSQSAFAGRSLSISEEINASEQQTNSHNKAIAWLLYSAGSLFCDPMEACAVYTKQCSTMLKYHRPDDHGRDAGRRRGQSPHRRKGHDGVQRPLRVWLKW